MRRSGNARTRDVKMPDMPIILYVSVQYEWLNDRSVSRKRHQSLKIMVHRISGAPAKSDHFLLASARACSARCGRVPEIVCRGCRRDDVCVRVRVLC